MMNAMKWLVLGIGAACLACSTDGGGNGGGGTGDDANATATGGETTGGETTGGETTGGETTGGNTGGADLTAARTQIVATICEKIESCYGDLAATFGITNCTENLGLVFEHQTEPQWQAAIDKGTMVYDGGKLAACISAIDAAGCSVSAELPTACTEAFVGQVAEGAACEDNMECVAGSFCPTGTACPSTCTAFPASGAACPDSVCDTGLVCAAGTCASPVAKGAACQGDGGGNCEAGLLCLKAQPTDADGACKSVDELLTKTAGQKCDAFAVQLCVDGLACALVGATAELQLEWECKAKVAAAGVCNNSFPSMCPDGTVCVIADQEFEGTCDPLPKAGEDCAGTENVTAVRCAAEHFCDTAANKCQALVATGMPCEFGSMCYSGACEDSECISTPLCD